METKEVLVLGTKILTVKVDDTVYVPVRRLCEMVGVINSSNQYAQIRDDELYAGKTSDIVPPSIKGTEGMAKPMFCLDIEMVTLFLARINASKIREDKRAGLVRYQLECAKILHAAWETSKSPTQLLLEVAQRNLNAIEANAQQISITDNKVEDLKFQIASEREKAKELLEVRWDDNVEVLSDANTRQQIKLKSRAYMSLYLKGEEASFWNTVYEMYRTLKSKDMRIRAKNRFLRINAEREAEGKKPYKTMKSKLHYANDTELREILAVIRKMFEMRENDN